MKTQKDFLAINCRRNVVAVTVAVLLTGDASLSAQVLQIDLPEINLLANTPGQTFDVFIQNGGASFQVTGIGFNLQVADGGPPAGGLTLGPSITMVDIFTGTIFASPNNNGPSGAGQIVPQVFERGTLTPSGTVSIPSGLSKIATVTLDTSGFLSGSFALTLGTLNGPTKYTTLAGDFFPTLLDGSVAVPEPSAYAAIFGISCLAGAVARRILRHFSKTRHGGSVKRYPTPIGRH